MKNLEQRAARYATRHWLAASMTSWPTVRQVARALRVRQVEVEEASEGCGSLMLQGCNCARGDLEVVADTPEIERAWCEYWRPYSARCFCGQHGGK
jgi:hypothetical protein